MIPYGELKTVFDIHKAGQTKFTRRMAINIADWFNVPVRDLIHQLERDGIVKNGTWDWFQANGGITRANIDQVREDRKAGGL